jgi:Protein of unknown function DUF111
MSPPGRSSFGGARSTVLLARRPGGGAGELVADAASACLDAGALDAWLTPVQMKKGRPGVVLTAVARPEHEARVVEAMARHSTTLGVRTLPVSRWELDREHRTVDVDAHVDGGPSGVARSRAVDPATVAHPESGGITTRTAGAASPTCAPRSPTCCVIGRTCKPTASGRARAVRRGELLPETAARDGGLRAVVSEGAGDRSVAEQKHMPDAPPEPLRWIAPITIETAAGVVLSDHLPPADLADLMPRIAPVRSCSSAG